MNQQRGLWGWLFQRITGAYLIFGLTVHIVVTHFATKSITFEWVSARLRHGGWFLFDFLLLTVCFYHGFNGLWAIVLDFNPNLKWRRGIGWGLFVVGIGWVVYGVVTLIPFAMGAVP